MPRNCITFAPRIARAILEHTGTDPGESLEFPVALYRLTFAISNSREAIRARGDRPRQKSCRMEAPVVLHFRLFAPRTARRILVNEGNAEFMLHIKI